MLKDDKLAIDIAHDLVYIKNIFHIVHCNTLLLSHARTMFHDRLNAWWIPSAKRTNDTDTSISTESFLPQIVDTECFGCGFLLTKEKIKLIVSLVLLKPDITEADLRKIST